VIQINSFLDGKHSYHRVKIGAEWIIFQLNGF